jgi:uncharacterized membrane protein HdeD (DUF308 family)
MVKTLGRKVLYGAVSRQYDSHCWRLMEMERTTKYILVNLAGLLSIIAGLLFSHSLGLSSFGLGLIIGSNLLFR